MACTKGVIGGVQAGFGTHVWNATREKRWEKREKFPPLAHLSRPETNLSAPNDACSTGYTTLGWSCAMSRKYCYLLACVTGAKRGGRGGGRKAPPLPFSLFPYPLFLSTPATQAITCRYEKLLRYNVFWRLLTNVCVSVNPYIHSLISHISLISYHLTAGLAHLVKSLGAVSEIDRE